MAKYYIKYLNMYKKKRYVHGIKTFILNIKHVKCLISQK